MVCEPVWSFHPPCSECEGRLETVHKGYHLSAPLIGDYFNYQCLFINGFLEPYS